MRSKICESLGISDEDLEDRLSYTWTLDRRPASAVDYAGRERWVEDLDERGFIARFPSYERGFIARFPSFVSPDGVPYFRRWDLDLGSERLRPGHWKGVMDEDGIEWRDAKGDTVRTDYAIKACEPEEYIHSGFYRWAQVTPDHLECTNMPDVLLALVSEYAHEEPQVELEAYVQADPPNKLIDAKLPAAAVEQASSKAKPRKRKRGT
jgi:hypothetical protein